MKNGSVKHSGNGGSDGSIYFIDEGGSRVQRYYKGITSPVAGGADSGDQAHQLEDESRKLSFCMLNNPGFPHSTMAAVPQSLCRMRKTFSSPKKAES